MKTLTPRWRVWCLCVAACALLAASSVRPTLHPAAARSGRTTTDSGKAAVAGEMASARITANGRTYEVSPNQVGCFDRVSNIQPLATALVGVTYPEGKVGQSVVIEVLDGGLLDNGKQMKVMPLGLTQTVSFHFQVSEQPGLHEVTLRKGTDLKIVQLWVGAEEPLARSNRLARW